MCPISLYSRTREEERSRAIYYLISIIGVERFTQEVYARAKNSRKEEKQSIYGENLISSILNEMYFENFKILKDLGLELNFLY